MITVVVNGQKRQLDGPMSLTECLLKLGVNLQFIAVAYNGQVLRKEEHQGVRLKEGDVLELVRPVGGG
ncbi:MAG: sulfur carrier protein ThiS [Chloroflexi bacterium]|nr:sulfur carrier protein ThiS [Chloroflexota bacterium]